MSKFWKGLGVGLAIGVVQVAIVACTAREAAKDAYTVQSEACVRAYDGNPTGQRSCLEYVRNRWTEAGAPTAAILDGGSHE